MPGTARVGRNLQPYQTLRKIPFSILPGNPISAISKARNELLTKFQSLESSSGKWQPFQTLGKIPFPVYINPFPVLSGNPLSKISIRLENSYWQNSKALNLLGTANVARFSENFHFLFHQFHFLFYLVTLFLQ